MCGFQMTVEKPKPKQLLRPITTGADSAMNHVHGANGFGFDSHWLKNWCESFKPITKRSNRNHVITFDSHLKISQTSTLTNWFDTSFSLLVHSLIN